MTARGGVSQQSRPSRAWSFTCLSRFFDCELLKRASGLTHALGFITCFHAALSVGTASVALHQILTPILLSLLSG